VIGAGHNGLVCAGNLAAAGREVTALERADRPGGAVHSREEPLQQIRNIEKAFDGARTPTTPLVSRSRGSTRRRKANIRRADDSDVDAVILSAAAETEHHEIAVYEGLITQAQTPGRDENRASAAGQPRAGTACSRRSSRTPSR
jgi:choline dehydrogenase-like flavoprotein